VKFRFRIGNAKPQRTNLVRAGVSFNPHENLALVSELDCVDEQVGADLP
jgi:hypothetical protein